MVNTALPTIGRSLRLDGSSAAMARHGVRDDVRRRTSLGGRISDLLSRRGVFLTGLALFTVASLVSGLADSGGQLIAARAVQGPSAAPADSPALALITTTRPAAQGRTRPVGAVGSLGVAAGVLIGGAITTWTSWYIF